MRWMIPLVALNMAACNALFSFRDKHPADTGTDVEADTVEESDAADTPADTSDDTAVDSGTDPDGDVDAGEEADADIDAAADPLPEIPDEPVEDCTGMWNFVPCVQVTLTDYWYDICSSEVCVTPGECGNPTCNAPGPHFPLPPVDRAPGEFAASEPDPSGHPGEYVVVDTITGLMWQDNLPGTYPGCSWDGGANCSQEQALEYCDGLEWAGHDDWYTPDEYELTSIIDYADSGPALTAPPFVMVSSLAGEFWASAMQDADPYVVGFDDGEIGALFAGYGRKVRCVRRHLAGIATTDRFTRTVPLANQPIVEDAVTGLVWQGCAKGFVTGGPGFCGGGAAEDEYWDVAGSYCNDLSWGGRDDWRLPDVRELRSLLDSRVATGPKIDLAAFPGFPEGDFWTSTQSAGDPTTTWRVQFSDGLLARPCNAHGSLCENLILCVSVLP